MQLALPAPHFVSRLFARAPRAITRWYAARVPAGRTREIPCIVGGRTTVHCRGGQAWITHDGDPRDVVLQARQSYAVDRGQRMTLHALEADCVVEIEIRG